MAIKHKHIKRCKMIMQCMTKDHNLGPGTLFVFKDKMFVAKYNVDTDDRNIVTSVPSVRRNYFTTHTIPAGDPVLFVDVVYDPHMRNHLLRFLHHEEMVAIVFKKGETIKSLKSKIVNELPDESDGG